MAPSLTPHEFVAQWSGDTRKERSVSQEHFLDLCRLVGHETPGENRDATLVFEAGAAKSDDPRVTAISEAAQRLVAQRDTWLNEPGLSEAALKQRTLTKLYNQRPPWLDQAHKELDQAVGDAYGWPHDLSDEEILARLLALNLVRAAKQGDAAAAAAETHTDDEE